MTTPDDSAPSPVEYDPESDAYYASFDPATDAVSSTVIESVASVLHRDPLDIPPLYECVDTDALDAIVDAAGTKSSPYLTVSFRFEETDVSVSADGTVVVEPDGVV